MRPDGEAAAYYPPPDQSESARARADTDADTEQVSSTMRYRQPLAEQIIVLRLPFCGRGVLRDRSDLRNYARAGGCTHLGDQKGESRSGSRRAAGGACAFARRCSRSAPPSSCAQEMAGRSSRGATQRHTHTDTDTHAHMRRRAEKPPSTSRGRCTVIGLHRPAPGTAQVLFRRKALTASVS